MPTAPWFSTMMCSKTLMMHPARIFARAICLLGEWASSGAESRNAGL
jgi:hypothetical protein